MQKILFHNADRTLNIPGKTAIKAFIPLIFENEKVLLARIDYVFCSDEFLLEINKRHLGHNYYTDIITFDLSENEAITGEIYISIDRVRENAVQFKTGFRKELLRILFHGALHLCGYKDKKKNEVKTMRKKEDYFMKHYQKYVSRNTVSL